MTNPDIFLSYNREDAATAKRFADAFAAEGLNVWWDATLRSGEAYDEVTEAALRGAKAVVVLWSPRSVVSRWVRAEATIADRCKTLVPVTIEACERPIMFELTQTAELSHWTGDAGDRAWLAFLGDVRSFVGKDRPAPQQTQAHPPTGVPPVAPGKAGEPPSLAVLPFTNRSGLAEDEVFALGMVEDLIEALSQGVSLRVISSSATARFRDGAVPDLDRMARQLGVRYLLEGNLRRVGENVRVTAQLVEAQNGAVQWTQRFDRPLVELAALQEDLVVEVAAGLDAQVNRVEMERALKKPDDLTAWEAVMRSNAAYQQLNADHAERALDEARRAVLIAPDYGLAYASLALAESVAHIYLLEDDAPGGRASIRAHAEKAIALEPNNALVLGYAASALVHLGLPHEAMHPAARAVQLSPGGSYGHYARAVACLMLNRYDEALDHIEAEMRAMPGSHRIYWSLGWKGNGLIRAGRWGEARATFDQAIALNPSATSSIVSNVLVSGHLDQLEDACAFMQQTRAIEPDATLSQWERRVSYWHTANPILPELLMHLRNAWAATESGA
jgi:TolB-like protein/Tfp pilus assembly protein PilF